MQDPAIDAPEPVAPSVAARLEMLEDWLERRRPLLILAIIIISATLRGIYFIQLSAGPCMWRHEWPESDMNTYHRWGLALAGGDWLLRDFDPPLHGWHIRIAADYYERHPDELELARLDAAKQIAAATTASATAPADSNAVDTLAALKLWHRWCGNGRFYHDPLYGYFVGIVYRVVGPHPWVVLLLQLMLGIAANVLLFLIARRCFGEIPAVVAVLLAVGYAPLVFHELVLLRDAPVVFAALLLVWLVCRALERAVVRSWLWAGLACGVAMLLKSHFALFAAIVVAVLLIGLPAPGIRRFLPLMAFVGGCVIGLLPVILRNGLVGVPLLSIASNGPLTFASANAVGAVGVNWDFDNVSEILERADGSLLATMVETLRTHPSAASYAAALADKLFRVLFWWEHSNNANVYYYQARAPLLRALPVSYGFISSLGIVGVVLSFSRRRTCWPLFAMIVTNLAVLLLFFTFARFRISLAACLIPFAAFALVWIAREFLNGHPGRGLRAAIPAIVLCIALMRPTAGIHPLISETDVDVSFDTYYMPRLREAFAEGDLTRVVSIEREILAEQPFEMYELAAGRPVRNAEEIALAEWFAARYEGHADLLSATGAHAEAAKAAQRAAALRLAAGRAVGNQQQ